MQCKHSNKHFQVANRQIHVIEKQLWGIVYFLRLASWLKRWIAKETKYTLRLSLFWETIQARESNTKLETGPLNWWVLLQWAVLALRDTFQVAPKKGVQRVHICELGPLPDKFRQHSCRRALLSMINTIAWSQFLVPPKPDSNNGSNFLSGSSWYW